MIDHKLKPWVIEINISPSFSVDTPLDFKIKKGVIQESIKLLALSRNKRIRFRKTRKTQFQQRVLTGKIEKKTLEQRILIRQNYDIKRNKKVN